MGYLCANISLPRPLCSQLTPDIRDRQIDDRQTEGRRASSLNTPTLGLGDHNKRLKIVVVVVIVVLVVVMLVVAVSVSNLSG